jgi:anti-sigma factor RsiW
VTTPNDHLQPQKIDAFVDRELQSDEVRVTEEHLATCHACTLQVLAAFETKRAFAVAASALPPSIESLARLTAYVRAATAPEKGAATDSPYRQTARLPFIRRRAGRLPLWSGIAACFAILVCLFAWQSRRDSATFTAELLDQHLATLSSAATPQVLSSDRHTVKPWFQGKLPFSFNLPEPAQLPPDTTLQGADLAYLDGHPAALLLFTIHKHHVSVFLTERNASISTRSSRSGFTLRSAATGHLRLIAVSDVNPPDIEALLNSLTIAQQAN